MLCFIPLVTRYCEEGKHSIPELPKNAKNCFSKRKFGRRMLPFKSHFAINSSVFKVLLYAKHHVHPTCIIINPCNNFMSWVPYYRGRHGDLGRLNNLPKVSELVSVELGSESQLPLGIGNIVLSYATTLSSQGLLQRYTSSAVTQGCILRWVLPLGVCFSTVGRLNLLIIVCLILGLVSQF